MSKLLPITTGVCFLGFIISLIMLFQTDYGLTTPFKLTFIFLSGTIAAFSFWKSENSLTIGLVAIVAFVGTLLIFFNTNLYLNYWNNVLALHVILIGIALYNMSRFPKNNWLHKITQIVTISTTLFFFVTLILKFESNPLFLILLVLLVLTSVLFVISQFVGLSKNEEEVSV